MTSRRPPALSAPASPKKIVQSSPSIRSQIRRAVASLRPWNEICSMGARSSSAVALGITVSGSTGTLRNRDFSDISQHYSGGEE